MLQNPFPHQVIRNFLNKEEAKELCKKLRKQKFYPKKSDLFQFSQTKELNKSKDFKEFISYLKSDKIIKLMEKEFKVNLNKKIDMFGSLYQDTDFLLPHDDRLSGRRIAFMLYLSDLEQKDGGAFLLYGKNRITKRIFPKFNNFVFFEVSPKSLHGVEEVVSKKKRYALSGWFHGD